MQKARGDAVDDTSEARAEAHMMLATLLAAPPDADLLGKLGQLRGDATPWGSALAGIAEAARATTAPEVEREYNRLFIGVQTGELVPYASYYITGFLHDRPLVALRTDMARLGIARRGDVAEPEDHIAALLEMMAGLLTDRFGAGPQEPKAFYDRHLGRWAPQFMADLKGAQAARFYRSVGTAGQVFLEIEQKAFSLV